MRESDSLSRRDLLLSAIGAAGALALPGTLSAMATPVGGEQGLRPPRSDIDTALRAERWIRSARTRTPAGIAWPADPAQPASISRDLYSGTPGVVLFYLELHGATGGARHLDEARAGADDLIANMEDAEFAGGLYTGVAGRAFTLAETWRATGDVRFRDAAARGVSLLRANARATGAGVEWNDVTDIISGSAGILLFLLYAARTLDDGSAIELADRAGRRLIELGQPAEAGTKWAMSSAVQNEYPNFSHGTAGIAYALATLYDATRDRAFLDAALAGAAYLEQVGTGHDDCRVFHHRPGGEELYYLSWCHGGPGTVRLFERLHALTGDAKWLERMQCHTRGITALGAPVERSPGYWNNISQCCGNAGVGEHFIALHRRWPDAGHLAVARHAADDILARATDDAGALKWVQAEHRVRPELLVAQTGRMQGAAGVGSFFLHLAAAEQGEPVAITLPDSPWA